MPIANTMRSAVVAAAARRGDGNPAGRGRAARLGAK